LQREGGARSLDEELYALEKTIGKETCGPREIPEKITTTFQTEGAQ